VCSVADADKLTDWLAGHVAHAERNPDRVREELLRRCREERIEPQAAAREGLGAARARGRTGGRKPKLNARQAATVRRMYEATGPDGRRQHTVAEIAEAVGVHRTTVYDYLKREG
jgi:DNA invertase Pin-like site-specific DNA recombinase